MSKGDRIEVTMRQGPPVQGITATKDGRSVRFRQPRNAKFGYLEEVSKGGKVVRTITIATDLIIAVEEQKRRG